MSTLYEFKIKKLEVTSKPISEMVEMTYHAMEDNFRWLLNHSKLDLKKESSKIKIHRFLELIKEVRDTHDKEELKNMDFFQWDKTDERLSDLRESYTQGGNLFHRYSAIIRNNLFHTVTEELDKVLPVLMVSVEIISIHPDAGYPRYRHNPNVTKSDERQFLLRLLSDAIYPLNRDSLLVKEAWKTTEWDKNREDRDYMMQASNVIWGFQRHKGLKIKPASVKAFWKRNAHQWWSDLKDDPFDTKSDNKPYELVSYDIMIHPGWEKELTPCLNERYESTAYWG